MHPIELWTDSPNRTKPAAGRKRQQVEPKYLWNVSPQPAVAAAASLPSRSQHPRLDATPACCSPVIGPDSTWITGPDARSRRVRLGRCLLAGLASGPTSASPTTETFKWSSRDVCLLSRQMENMNYRRFLGTNNDPKSLKIYRMENQTERLMK